MFKLKKKKKNKLNFTTVFHKVGQKHEKAFFHQAESFSNATCIENSGREEICEV